ncbi:MAG: hypothetical protein WKG01_24010 [Kofleriaceae bacterium]
MRVDAALRTLSCGSLRALHANTATVTASTTALDERRPPLTAAAAGRARELV